ncbi:MAG: methionine--tRNA ligase [Alphaproteobacteria bacterium]
MSRILITSALPYINGVKHLGNLVGSMLPADVYARFMRARGHDVLAICATDEHGTPAELAAAEAGQPVAAYCAEQHEIQKRLGEGFGLSWDHFGRTSSPNTHRLTQHLAVKLNEAGLIEERSIRMVYSNADERFLPDRYIIGTCPHCGYDRARGDQCENCTRVLDPTDLIAPRSAVSGSTDLEVRDTKHLYLRQSQMVDRLRTWIDGQTTWSHLVTSIARKWLDEGLQDRGITRDLAWGIPVAHDGHWPDYQGKVFYVWFDAPIGYIGATAEWAEAAPDGEARDWKAWWYGEAAADVRYVQFMGKDNVPFHTVGFPLTLMGSGEPWTLVDTIKGFNWLTYYGGKFSTSQKRGVFMDQALDILPADYWRYYLMANVPEGADSSFTWDHFAGTVNKDLADVLGNFVNRILRFTKSKFGNVIPDGGEPGAAEAALAQDLEQRIAAYTDFLEAMEFRKAMAELRAIWVLGNEYLTEAAPWTAFKENPDKAAVAVRTGINLIRLCAVLGAPVIPATAGRILEALGLPADATAWPDRPMAEELERLPAGHAFSVPDVLFAKIEDADLAAWTERFGGAGDPPEAPAKKPESPKGPTAGV